MPTYEYLCKSCGHDTEIFHMMSDTEERLCPECNKPMTKLIGCGHAIIMKSNSPQSQIQREIKNREEKAKSMRNTPKTRTHEGTGSGRGRALGGQHFEVDKKEFIQAAAKDPATVKAAQDALKRAKKKN